MKKLVLLFNISSVTAHVLNGKQARSHTEFRTSLNNCFAIDHSRESYFTDTSVEVLVCAYLPGPT